MNKFTIQKSVLQSKLKQVGKIVNANSSMPILTCVQMSVVGDKLYFVGADEAGSLQFSTDKFIKDLDTTDFTFCVTHKTLISGINNVPEQPIDIIFDEKTMDVIIAYQSGKFKMYAESDTIKDIVTTDVPEEAITIRTADLIKGIKRTAFSTSDNDLRPVLNGVLLEIKGSTVSYVGTDGARLALYRYLGTDGEGEKSSIILPSKFCNSLTDVIPLDECETMKVFIKVNDIVFCDDNIVATYRIIEGNFPNYEAVIPRDNHKQVIVNRMDFVSMLKRVLVFANNTQLIILDVQPGRITAKALDMDQRRSAEEELHTEYNGEPVTIGFNGSTLQEILLNMPQSENINLKLKSATTAALIEEEIPNKTELAQYLLMPVTINI